MTTDTGLSGAFAAVLLVLCACAAPPRKAGEACDDAIQCPASLTCRDGKCAARSPAGGPCAEATAWRDCEPGLLCGPERTCVSPAALEAIARAAKQAEAEEMLRASGVDPTAASPELAPVPPGPGLRVRVARTRGTGTAFAACRTDERLVSGGCASVGNLRASRPDAFGATDTVGARWTCDAFSAAVDAFALCQALAVP